jgi:hypothetical protein
LSEGRPFLSERGNSFNHRKLRAFNLNPHRLKSIAPPVASTFSYQ